MNQFYSLENFYPTLSPTATEEPGGTWTPPTSTPSPTFTQTATGTWYSSTPTPTPTHNYSYRYHTPVITMADCIIWDDIIAAAPDFPRILSHDINYYTPAVPHYYIRYSDVKNGSGTPTPYAMTPSNISCNPLFVDEVCGYGEHYFLSSTPRPGGLGISCCIDEGSHDARTPYILHSMAYPIGTWIPATTPTSEFFIPTVVYYAEYSTEIHYNPDFDEVDMGYHHVNKPCPRIPVSCCYCLIFLGLITGLSIVFYIDRKIKNWERG